MTRLLYIGLIVAWMVSYDLGHQTIGLAIGFTILGVSFYEGVKLLLKKEE